MAFQTDDGVSKTDVWVSAAEGGVRVVALWDAHVVTKKLSAGGVYTVGRAPECEVRVDHPSVSRRHARLHVGDVIRIEDLGSANGTIVGRTRLAPSSTVDWTPGDLLVIGATTLFLQSTEQSRDELVPSVSRAPASPWPESGAMGRIARVLALVAPGDITVLLLGETGVGKELAAETVHRLSRRAEQPFVRLNCAALPENLLESELFGYERGAFTGATRQTPGKIETAHRGTLFLDEIGDLPLALQPKLLRFLQERAIERLGGRDSIAVDVRVVCATHRDPKAQIAAGELREDLYYRLAEIVLSIPPLRSRIGDPGLLAHFFLRKFSASSKRGSMSLSAGAIEAIEAHPWAGNVRELESAIKRAVIMAERNQLQASDLGLQDADGAAPVLNLQAIRERAEREAVARALGRANGNITKAAELLGVSRPTLYDLMARAGLRSAGPPADE